MKIPQDVYDQMLDHARSEVPNECCGLVGGKDGTAVTYYPANNSEGSPFRYNLDPQDQFRIMMEMEEKGEELAAIYHSHTRSAAYPSQTDVNLAANWPDPLYLICSLEDPDSPVVRAFAICDGSIEEAGLEMTDG
jgi:[CysO sulfur-carrier protein]-S-L-cysteine hydrolase